MAVKKKTSTKQELRGVPINKLRALWSTFSTHDIASVLNELAPANEWKVHGSDVRGLCPYHDESTPSFWVKPGARHAKCFGAGCEEYVTDPLTLFAKAGKMSHADVYSLLRPRFNIELGAKVSENLQAYDDNQKLKQTLSAIFNKELVGAHANPGNPRYAYAEGAVEYLKKRGLNMDMGLQAYPMVGVFPNAKIISEEIQAINPALEGPALEYLEKYLKAAYIGGIVFTYNESPQAVSKFRIRVPWTEEGKEKAIVLVEDPFAKNIGFFGLSAYHTLLGKNKRFICVEGEFDQLAFFTNQLTTMRDEVVISSGGKTGINALDSLAEFGLSECLIIGDSPEAKGDAYVEEVLRNCSKLEAKVYNWPAKVRAKDPDEAIKLFGYQPFYLTITEDTSWQRPYQWVTTKARELIETQAADDIRGKTTVIRKYAECLNSDAERDEYLKTIAEIADLDLSTIKKEVRAAASDERGFIARIAAEIKTVYSLVCSDSRANSNVIIAWSKKKREERVMKLSSPGEIEAEMTQDVGLMADWVKETVGEPPFFVKEMADGTVVELDYLQKKVKLLQYVAEAWRSLAPEIRARHQLKEKSQGIHGVNINGEPGVAVINGDQVFYGRWYEGDNVIFEEIDSPRREDLLFTGLNAVAQWSPTAVSVEHLMRTHQVDVKALYDKLQDMLRKGWTFRHQEVDTAYLAAFVLAIPIFNFMKRQTYLFITADRSSGKSRLVQGFLGGDQFPDICVVEHKRAMEDYTEAGIRQSMNNSSHCLCLDEFEDDGSQAPKARQVRDVMRMLRASIGQAAATMIRGAASGDIKDVKRYSIRFPVVMAAIRTTSEPADLSRLITIKMQKDNNSNRPPPEAEIMKYYSQEDIEAVRASGTIAMLRYIPKLQRLYSEIEREYHEGGSLPPGVPSRYREGLYPVLSVMKLLGLDYAKFAKEFCLTRWADIQQINTTTESDNLLNAILSSPIAARIEGRVGASTTIQEMLMDRTERGFINQTGSGVRYGQVKVDGVERHLLMVQWVNARQGVLKNHTAYQAYADTTLFSMASAGDNVIPADKVKDPIKEFFGPQRGGNGITVYDITSLVDEMDLRLDKLASMKPLTQTDPDAEVDFSEETK